MSTAHNIEHGKRGWTRTETAELLGVTQARVSQIAKEMGIRMRWHWQDGFTYTVRDVLRMKGRDTKPGPKKQPQRRTR